MSATGERAAVTGARAGVTGERAVVTGERAAVAEPCAMPPLPDARARLRIGS